MTTLSETNVPHQCSIPGDDNIYGVGLRAGLYAQWAGIIIAYHHSVNNSFVASLIAGMSVFQMAILVTLVWKTITSFDSSSLYDIEAFIVIMFGLGGGLGAQIHVLVSSSRPRATNRFLDFVSTALMLGFASYGVWFWYVGVKSLPHAPCGSWVFFFSRVRLHGWFTVFSRVVITICLLLVGIIMLLQVWGLIVNWSDRQSWLLGHSSTAFPNSSSAPALQLDWRIELVGQFLALGLFISIVEMTIRWNHIAEVDSLQSTGQLIPLIIGICGLLFVLIPEQTERTAD